MHEVMELSRWLLGYYKFARVNIPSIWAYTRVHPNNIPQAPNPKGFDVKILGLFAAEVDCFWGTHLSRLHTFISIQVYVKVNPATAPDKDRGREFRILTGRWGRGIIKATISVEEMEIDNINPARRPACPSNLGF